MTKPRAWLSSSICLVWYPRTVPLELKMHKIFFKAPLLWILWKAFKLIVNRKKNILNWLYWCFNQRGEKSHTVYTAYTKAISQKKTQWSLNPLLKNIFSNFTLTCSLCFTQTMNLLCAADFSLLNLPKGKSLGRSKPATNSYAQALQHTVRDDSYYIQALLNCLL